MNKTSRKPAHTVAELASARQHQGKLADHNGARRAGVPGFSWLKATKKTIFFRANVRKTEKQPPQKHKNTPKKHPPKYPFFSRLRAKKKAKEKLCRLRAENHHVPGLGETSQKRRSSRSGSARWRVFCARDPRDRRPPCTAAGARREC